MGKTTPRSGAVKVNGFRSDERLVINDQDWSLVIHSASAGAASRVGIVAGEALFVVSFAGIVVIGWLALVLAHLGLLSRIPLLLALGSMAAIATGVAVRSLVSQGASRAQQPRSREGGMRNARYAIRHLTWHCVALVMILLLATVLYTPPADYAPAFLDAGWYTNTGALIARTGSLTVRPPEFEALPAADRNLFVRTYHDIKGSLPQFPDRHDLGFYNLVFAIDLGQNGPVVPYHPPLASAWIAMLRILGGPALSTYTAPLFGLLFVVAVYAAGCAIFGRYVGLVGALLTALAPPVVYYARTPFAELLAGAFIWAGVYALSRYATTSRASPAAHHHRIRAPLLILAGLTFGAALLAKFESLLLLPAIILFWLIWLRQHWATKREFATFLTPFGILGGYAALLYATVSRPYLILNGYGIWSSVMGALSRPVVWGTLTVLYLVGIVVLVANRGLRKSLTINGIPTDRYPSPLPSVQASITRFQSATSVVILAGAGIALLLAWPAMQANAPSAGSALATLALFLTPLGLCLGIVGLSTLVADDLNRRTAFMALLVGTAGLTTLLMPAISSNVSYLYTVRRQLPVVLPALLLLTGYVTLRWAGLADSTSRTSNPSASLRRGLVILMLALVSLNFLDTDRSLIGQQELAGSSAFVARLAEKFEPGDVVLFESVDRGTHVGRFAALLWADYGVAAMLLSSTYPPQDQLAKVIERWQHQGRRVYFVSQSQPPPFTLPGIRWDLASKGYWAGATIAAKMAFPPEMRLLQVPFHIYKAVSRSSESSPSPPE